MSVWSISAPSSTRNWTTALWPFRQAQLNADRPSLSREERVAPERKAHSQHMTSARQGPGKGSHTRKCLVTARPSGLGNLQLMGITATAEERGCGVHCPLPRNFPQQKDLTRRSFLKKLNQKILIGSAIAVFVHLREPHAGRTVGYLWKGETPRCSGALRKQPP